MPPFQFHPPISAFPVALISVVLFLELLGFTFKSARIHSAANINLALAVAAVVLAFFSGYQASEYADGTFKIADDAIARHHLLGKLLLFSTLVCASLSAIGEKAKYGAKFFHAAYLFFLLVSFALVAATGYQGGKLVFEHGAGVRVPQAAGVPAPLP